MCKLSDKIHGFSSLKQKNFETMILIPMFSPMFRRKSTACNVEGLQYTVPGVPECLSHRRNWVSPSPRPPPPDDCVPPINPQWGGRNTLWGRRGGGGYPILTTGQKAWHSVCSVACRKNSRTFCEKFNIYFHKPSSRIGKRNLSNFTKEKHIRI